MTQLLSAIHQAALEDQARSMAAVILRRLFASEFQEFYSVVSFVVTCYTLLFYLYSVITEFTSFNVDTSYELCYH